MGKAIQIHLTEEHDKVIRLHKADKDFRNKSDALLDIILEFAKQK